MEGKLESARKRKKQTSACDECRKGKTKCDGKSPCERCIKRETSCVFSPQKRRGARKKPKLHPNSDVSTHYTPPPDESHKITHLHNQLLDIYFRYFNPMFIFPISRPALADTSDSSCQLQYVIALAFASRATGDTSKTAELESQARAIAGQVFDTFTEATALAFAMMTCYYWGQDQAKSKFYFVITRAMCGQIGPKLDPAKSVLIEAMASCCIVNYDSYVEDLLERMAAAYDTSTQDKFKRQLRVAIILVEIKFGLIRAYPIGEGEKYMSTLIDFQRLHKSMSAEASSVLLSKLDFVERIMTSEHNQPVFRDVLPLLSSFFNYFRSMLHFVNGEFELGVQVANQIVENCVANAPIMCYSPPALVLCNHYAFCVSYLTGNVSMAVKATGVLRSLSVVLPVAELSLFSDSKRLKRLINSTTQGNSQPNGSFSISELHPLGSPPPVVSPNCFFDPSAMRLFEQDTSGVYGNSFPHIPHPQQNLSPLTPSSIMEAISPNESEEQISEVDELFGPESGIDLGRLIHGTNCL